MPGFGTLSPGEEAEQPPNVLAGFLARLGYDMASLPKRAIDASAADVANLGDHSQPLQSVAPAVETALMTMGGTSFGAPSAAGEAVLGAGPVRRAAELPMDEASRLARAQQQGYTLDAYHATRAPEFDAFKRKQNDLGMHFGTAEQANDRLDYTRRPHYGAELDPPERVMPVKLNIQNPLRLNDLGHWGSDNLRYGLENAGFASDDLLRAIRSAGNESGKVAALRDLIKQRGYDGVVYKNTGEVAGSQPFKEAEAAARVKLSEAFPGKYHFSLEDQAHPAYKAYSEAGEAYRAHRENNAVDSYIAFHPSQVRSQFAAFDPANKGKGTILGAGAGDRRGAIAMPLAEVMDRSGGTAADVAAPYHDLLKPTAKEQALNKVLGVGDEFKVPPLKRGYNAGVDAPADPLMQTVADPYRNHFPGIYGNPRELAAEAAARVAPEDPALKRLWGVDRGDLDQMAIGRVGNEEPNLRLAKNPKGSLAAQNIQTPQNTQRLVDVLGEGGKYPGLAHADSWYVMDPVFQRLEQMFGPEEAVHRFKHLNTMTGMASPGSDVLTEIQRGTAAHWLEQQGRFGDFQKFGGVPEELRSRRAFPQDMRYIGGHPYHRTSQADPMAKYLEAGAIQSDAPKVPLYVHASGVPQTGFQTAGPVGDAHFSRGVGLSDTRMGPTDVQGSFSRAEYQTLQPWWQHEVAGKVGIESVPAQARLWTVLGPQTGVESPLGAGKLELLSRQIMVAARRLGVTPEKARDMILSGKAGAGVVAGGMAAPAVFGAMGREPE